MNNNLCDSVATYLQKTTVPQTVKQIAHLLKQNPVDGVNRGNLLGYLKRDSRFILDKNNCVCLKSANPQTLGSNSKEENWKDIAKRQPNVYAQCRPLEKENDWKEMAKNKPDVYSKANTQPKTAMKHTGGDFRLNMPNHGLTCVKINL